LTAPIAGGTTPKEWFAADQQVYKDAGSTLCVDGDTVQQWNDLSGTGNNATQATSGRRPTYHTNKLNGLPSITFTRSNTNYMNRAFTGDPLTVFVVLKAATLNNFQAFLGADEGNASPPAIGGYYFQVNGAQSFAFYRCTTTDTTVAGDFGAVWGATNPSTGTPYIFKGWRSGTTIGVLPQTQYSGPTSTYTTQWATSTSVHTLRTIAAPIVLGADVYSRAVVDHWDGEIYEVIIYDVALTDAEIAQVESYLWHKWGFGASTLNYLMCNFLDPGASNQLTRLLESADSASWYLRPINYVPTSGHVARDPSLTKLSTGIYWLAHTNVTDPSNKATSFDVASSPDGVAFNYVFTIDCSSITGGTANARCWAPEWFIDADDSVHILVTCSSDATNFQICEVHPTNATYTAWSAPVVLSGVPSTGEIIDPYMVLTGGAYYLWFKDNQNPSNNYITVYKSSSLLSGYSAWRTGDWAGWGTNVLEGPSVWQTADSSWHMAGDRYIAGTGIATSSQTAGDWTGGGSTTWGALTNISIVVQCLNSAYTTRHGTVFPIVPFLDQDGAPWPKLSPTEFPSGIEAGGPTKAVAGGWM